MRRIRQRGFTLVELLVVIGIIALLIGILLPALSKARDASKRAACLANLRTLGQCLYVYVNDNKGKGFMGAYSVQAATGYTSSLQYWFAQKNSAGAAVTWDTTAGYLRPYYRTDAFLNCPAASSEYSKYNLGGTVTAPLTTYAYNSLIAVLATPTGSSSVAKMSAMSQLQKSAETMALLDGLIIGNTWSPTGVFASGQPQGTSAPYAPTSATFQGRHSGNGNVLWYDGHASSETPYVTGMDSNLDTTDQFGEDFLLKLKIGFLTPLTKANTPEAQLMSNPTTSYINYYYWASKTGRQ